MCSMSRVGRLNRNGMDACRNGRFDEAEVNLLAALDLARAGGTGCTLAKLHSNLGIVYEMQGLHQNAVFHYRSAIDIISKKSSPTHPLRMRLDESLDRVASIAPAAAQA